VAVSATTGPSPARSVWTWVSVTLNGPFTSTRGAAVSVDPVTATLPVAPGSVQSALPPASGAAVGHELAAAFAVSVTEDATTSATEDDVVVEGLSVSELHAASVTTSDAAQATSAAEEDRREEFTAVTVPRAVRALLRQPDDGSRFVRNGGRRTLRIAV
jgi:hypothetical protein